MSKNIIVKAFKELFHASRTMFVLSYLFTLLQGLSKVLPIIAVQRLFDQIYLIGDGGSIATILKYLAFFVTARMICHCVDFAVNYLYEYYNMAAGRGMADHVNRKIYSAGGIEFEKTEFLEKINKAYRGTKSIRSYIDTWMIIS